jgi:hypothetical protein
MFLQFRTNKASLKLKNLICRKNSFSKLHQLSHGNHVLDDPDSNTDEFFQEIHVFPELSCLCLLEETEPISTLKNLSCRKYLYHQLPQISQVNRCSSSNTYGFLSRDTSVPSTQLNGPILNQKSLSSP